MIVSASATSSSSSRPSDGSNRGGGASGMTGPLIADAALRELLAVPESWGIAALAPVGFPDEEPKPVPRKGLDAVVRWIG